MKKQKIKSECFFGSYYTCGTEKAGDTLVLYRSATLVLIYAFPEKPRKDQILRYRVDFIPEK